MFMSFIEEFKGGVYRSWCSLVQGDETSKCREGPGEKFHSSNQVLQSPDKNVYERECRQ
jgi:hypothetical protein